MDILVGDDGVDVDHGIAYNGRDARSCSGRW
jgi:hypothetical protein